MQFGFTSSLLSAVAGLFLIFGGITEWGARSGMSCSWEDEKSFAALQLRAQGKLKFGLGIGFFALACAGSIPTGSLVNSDFKSEFDKREEPLTSTTTPQPPLPKPPAAPLPKPPTGTSSASTMPVKPPTFKKG